MAIIRLLVFVVILLIFLASQLYWFRRIAEWGEKLISNRQLRRALAGAGAIIYIVLFAYQIAWHRGSGTPTHMTWEAAVFQAPFQAWVIGSLLGFAIAILFWTGDRLTRLAAWCYRKAQSWGQARSGSGAPDLPSPQRRQFLEQAAKVVSATPFVASAYGLVYGRIEVETTHQPLKLKRLPKAFHGFRIAQLSDIHIGPFMTAREVQKCVSIANQLRPDLVVLTGDFITWDPATQDDVVNVLADLKAPFGRFGCLGNHELWADVEDSITEMFARRDIRMLRDTTAVVTSQGEKLNLIGVDYQSRRRFGPPGGRPVRQYLEGVDRLMLPDTVNILLSHNPNTFDRAAELGIDLSLAGHTHGGQVTLEFIHPDLSPSRLITDYGRGRFEKRGSQLYVNRGIGTIFVPIRLGATPEITLFELVREG
jgi:predicted MPP superfamily phosphohydrolase